MPCEATRAAVGRGFADCLLLHLDIPGVFGGVETFFPFVIRQVRVNPLDSSIWVGYDRKFYPNFNDGTESHEAYGPYEAELQSFAYTDYDTWAQGFAAQPQNELFGNVMFMEMCLPTLSIETGVHASRMLHMHTMYENADVRCNVHLVCMIVSVPLSYPYMIIRA